jgi:hypothetical protein
MRHGLMTKRVGVGQNQSPKTYLVGTYANGYTAYGYTLRISHWVYSEVPVGSFANGYAQSQR